MRVAAKRSEALFRGTAKLRIRGVVLLGIAVRAATFIACLEIIAIFQQRGSWRN
jgi:hypothetical protein